MTKVKMNIYLNISNKFSNGGKKMKTKLTLIILMLFVTSSLAYAGGTLPFESGLSKISNSLSGPVAISIAVIAFAAAGIMYVFNPDATALIKGLIGLCIALGVMFGGKVFVDLIAKPSSSGNIIPYSYIIEQAQNEQQNL